MDEIAESPKKPKRVVKLTIFVGVVLLGTLVVLARQSQEQPDYIGVPTGGFEDRLWARN